MRYVNEDKKKKVERKSKVMVLDNDYKVNESLMKKGTTVIIKEGKASDNDIVLEKAIRMNDVVLTKGDVIREMYRDVEEFIDDNREELTSMVARAAGVSRSRIDDDEIEMWIMNDEGLYNWAKSEIQNFEEKKSPKRKAKKTIKEDYGWEIRRGKEWDAFEDAVDNFGADTVAEGFAGAMGTDELGENLSFMFRNWDYQSPYLK